MTSEPPCVVCGGPGRYVREAGPGAEGWCERHVPAATPPWVWMLRALFVLGVLAAALYALGFGRPA